MIVSSTPVTSRDCYGRSYPSEQKRKVQKHVQWKWKKLRTPCGVHRSVVPTKHTIWSRNWSVQFVYSIEWSYRSTGHVIRIGIIAIIRLPRVCESVIFVPSLLSNIVRVRGDTWVDTIFCTFDFCYLDLRSRAWWNCRRLVGHHKMYSTNKINIDE